MSMGSKVAGTGGGGGVDHDQILAAVVVALGKSSSKVANYNSCEDSSGEIDAMAAQAEESIQKPAKSHHSILSCFAKPSSIKSATSRLPSWPKSPSHIMSRLLLSPDMTPDRIVAKSVPCSPAPGDQSPARPTSRLSSSRSQFSQFSGPLLGFKSSKSKSNKSKSKSKQQEVGLERELREEPTSPKVTCMGTVKAPKKKKKTGKVECTDLNSCRPPKWKRCQTSVQQQDYSGGLLVDLSRFSQMSGELKKSGEVVMIKPHSKRVYAKSSSNPPQQELEEKDSQSRAPLNNVPSTDGRSHVQTVPMGILTDSDQNVRVVAARSKSLSCRDGLKRPEEICLWKRRCVSEPLRLDVITRN